LYKPESKLKRIKESLSRKAQDTTSYSYRDLAEIIHHANSIIEMTNRNSTVALALYSSIEQALSDHIVTVLDCIFDNGFVIKTNRGLKAVVLNTSQDTNKLVLLDDPITAFTDWECRQAKWFKRGGRSGRH